MNRYLAAATIAASILLTLAGYPAYGIIPLGIMIAVNGQRWK